GVVAVGADHDAVQGPGVDDEAGVVAEAGVGAGHGVVPGHGGRAVGPGAAAVGGDVEAGVAGDVAQGVVVGVEALGAEGLGHPGPGVVAVGADHDAVQGPGVDDEAGV